MECIGESYWHTEYRFHKNHTVDTPANNEYQRFAKRQYHKARRRHDQKIIERQLQEIRKEEVLLNEIFDNDRNILRYL